MKCRLRMVEVRMENSDRFEVRSRNRRMARQRMFRRKPVGKEMKASMKERKKELKKKNLEDNKGEKNEKKMK